MYNDGKNKRTIFRKVIVVTILFFLNACAVHGTKFECVPGKGVGCKSVSKVNKMVDKDQIPDLDDKDIFLPSAGTEVQAAQQKRIWIAPRKASDGSHLNETYIEVY